MRGIKFMSVEANLQIFAQFPAKIVYLPQQFRGVARSVKLQNDMKALRNFGFNYGALNGSRILYPFLFHCVLILRRGLLFLKIHNLFNLHPERRWLRIHG